MDVFILKVLSIYFCVCNVITKRKNYISYSLTVYFSIIWLYSGHISALVSSDTDYNGIQHHYQYYCYPSSLLL